MILKYYAHLVFGVNHIFETEDETVALCGRSNYAGVYWTSDSDENGDRRTCKNCTIVNNGGTLAFNDKKAIPPTDCRPAASSSHDPLPSALPASL